VSGYREAVAAALEALRIESPTSFSWCGEPGAGLAPEVSAAMPADTARAYLSGQLEARLYASFYCSGTPTQVRPGAEAGRPYAPSPFLDGLSRANRGSGSREPGWTVVRVEEDGRVVVRRGGLSLWARPEEVSGAGSEPGSAVSVAMPRELLRLSPGFYMALGDAEMDPEEPLVRHYWNLESAGGAALVAAGTGFLNRAGVPFRLKVAHEPAGYGRRDAGVLYTPRRESAAVSALLPEVRAAVAAHLRPGGPALTKPLAEGLAVAEDPGGGESFGTHRCGLLAEGAIRAFELGVDGTDERVALVEAQFEAAGIDFERPYLNAGSVDEYEPVG
jgi:hypothetical protein